MLDEAEQYASEHPHSAGNGALMRTAVVALSALDDRVRGARSARRVANLTHADPLAGDSCVLWTEAVRVAVLDGRVDVSAGLDLLPASIWVLSGLGIFTTLQRMWHVRQQLNTPDRG